MAEVLELFPAGDPGWNELHWLELELLERLQRDLRGLTRHVPDQHPVEGAIVVVQAFVRATRIKVERRRRNPPR